MLRSIMIVLSCALFVTTSLAQELPKPTEGDAVLKNFQFTVSEGMAEVTIHYRTLGTPKKNDQGVVQNAVLILHGTTGSGANFLNERFANELFRPGQLLDISKY